MSRHFEIVARFKAKVDAGSEGFDVADEKDRVRVGARWSVLF